MKSSIISHGLQVADNQEVVAMEVESARDGYAGSGLDSVMIRPTINPLLSQCGYGSFTYRASSCVCSTTSPKPPRKAKRTTADQQACLGSDKANLDTFLANLKQGNAELMEEYLLNHNSD